jgi:hypothetical protein
MKLARMGDVIIRNLEDKDTILFHSCTVHFDFIRYLFVQLMHN